MTAPATSHSRLVLERLINGECWDLDELTAHSGLTRRQVVDAAGRLIRDDLAERVERGCYQATDAGVLAWQRGDRLTSGPRESREVRRTRREALNTRLWAALRLERKSCIPDLLVKAVRGGERDAAHNAARYLRALRRAGYVRELPGRAPGSAPTSNGHKRYALLVDSGPLAPVARRDGLYDPNRKELIPWPTG